MNDINFHNLLCLSKKLRQCASEADRQELLATILKSSTHTWHHINLSGEYVFLTQLNWRISSIYKR
ncbi:hypothetical protein ACFSUS_26135 [Spirosoma soli]|uniref:Transposase n=1 Tax=Spirosoma soli TaxID=1770529 RepID=A0ABW5MAQ2_9BACT